MNSERGRAVVVVTCLTNKIYTQKTAYMLDMLKTAYMLDILKYSLYVRHIKIRSEWIYLTNQSEKLPIGFSQISGPLPRSSKEQHRQFLFQ